MEFLWLAEGGGEGRGWGREVKRRTKGRSQRFKDHKGLNVPLLLWRWGGQHVRDVSWEQSLFDSQLANGDLCPVMAGNWVLLTRRSLEADFPQSLQTRTQSSQYLDFGLGYMEQRSPSRWVSDQRNHELISGGSLMLLSLGHLLPSDRKLLAFCNIFKKMNNYIRDYLATRLMGHFFPCLITFLIKQRNLRHAIKKTQPLL